MTRPIFGPGFRLSFSDIAFLVVGSGVGASLVFFSAAGSLVVLFVVGHFFLFCNVFRISRGLELAWGGVFTVLAAATMASGIPGWYVTTAISIAMTVAVIAMEMRKPSYHGVFWQRVNPRLPEWWKTNAVK